ncbi:MAG: CPBP family intramembrane metalloprotease [Chloroflexi bacterium]|nr:CPBP family intramembrane metalloprotease [Chloroflexota bacterium]
MNAELQNAKDRLWIYTVLPPLILGLVGMIVFGAYYALQAASPETVQGIAQGQVFFGFYIYVGIVEWCLAASILRRRRREGSSLRDVVLSGGGTAFRWPSAIVLFCVLNALAVLFMLGLSQTLGDEAAYEGLALWQRLFLLVHIPITAGFCEELIWRGHVIPRLEGRGRRRWAAILLSAVSFALIHGTPFHWVFTFLFGVVAGLYYTRERRLLPLMVSHAVVDLWTFGWAFFL